MPDSQFYEIDEVRSAGYSDSEILEELLQFLPSSTWENFCNNGFAANYYHYYVDGTDQENEDDEDDP